MGKPVRAVFDGQVFRLEEPLDLKVNTTGRIYFEPDNVPPQEEAPFAFVEAALAVHVDAPSDFSESHDDYLHRGKPWRK